MLISKNGEKFEATTFHISDAWFNELSDCIDKADDHGEHDLSKRLDSLYHQLEENYVGEHHLLPTEKKPD